MNHHLDHKFSGIPQPSEEWADKEINGLNKPKVSRRYFLQCTRPSGHFQATWFDTKHVEKIDFIAKTCKHNMYTDMFYFFYLFYWFFLYIFRNIQVDISHIFSGILCYFLSLWSILTIVKIINKTYRFVYFYNTMYSKKAEFTPLYISLTSTFFYNWIIIDINIIQKNKKQKNKTLGSIAVK